MEFFVHTLCIMHPVLKQRMSISHSYITAHTHTNTHRLSTHSLSFLANIPERAAVAAVGLLLAHGI